MQSENRVKFFTEVIISKLHLFFLIIMTFQLLLPFGVLAVCSGNSGNYHSVSDQLKAEDGCHSKDKLNYQLSLAYWNDNFLTIRNFEPWLNVGKDDNVTASFWLQVAFESNSRWYLLNIYQSILTKKKMNYRTDLLSIFSTVEQQFSRYEVTIGLGLIARGNYGGEFIQTSYHDLRNFTPVDLPYKGNNSLGLLLLTETEYGIIEKNKVRLSGFVSNYLRTGPGPGSLKTGLKLNLRNDPNVYKHVIHFQLLAGHSLLYHVDEYISPMFNSCLFQGALISFNLTKSFLTSFWISRNQYGLNQTYFGATLTFGWDGVRLGDLTEVLYP